MLDNNLSMIKRAVKSVTSPQMRDIMRKLLLQIYTSIGVKKDSKNVNRPFGINLIGHIRGDFGLGQSCRILAEILRTSKIPFSIFNIPLSANANERDTSWSEYEQDTLPYNINLIHINPSKLLEAVWKIKSSQMQGRYNIAYWLWELPEFPDEWVYAIKLFDEIWVPTEFIAKAIRKKTDKPVRVLPYGIEMPQISEKYDREYFGLPKDKTLFMVSYDGNSVSERKNPKGCIRAFCKAFSPDDTEVGLVIKATHAKKDDIDFLNEMTGKYQNVFLLTDSYSRIEFNSLIKNVDVYVSLHRAEGFGLVMAEAMLLKTAVIATNWSANTEFMNNDTACMVPAEVVELKHDIPPYKKGTHWANPDEKNAAEYMRKLYDDDAFREEKIKKAQLYVINQLSKQKAADKIRMYVKELCS